MPSPIDIAIVVIYLIATVWVGLACSGKQESDEDYFTARGGFSKWLGALLVGLSIAATFFSGISMLAYPSESYGRGPAIALVILTVIISAPPVLFWFLPRFLNSGCKEPYELIERRFGYPTRAVASSMFVLLRIGWMGTLIYAPTAALIAAFDLPGSWFWPIVLTIGISSTIYTAWGGLRGVIVTDAIQFIVMIVGILWPIYYVMTHLPANFIDALMTQKDAGQWIKPELALSFTAKRTVWSLMIGTLVANFGMYMADQMSLQRYLASGSLKSARQAFLVNVGGVICVILLLTLLGLAMAVWYSQSGNIPPESSDAVFPRFVTTVLPVGAPGLIFAAILAATMSSMTSGINSLAAAITLDLGRHFHEKSSSQTRLRFAKGLSVAIGLISTAAAGLVSRLGPIFDISQSVIGVFVGPILACIVFAISGLRVTSGSVMLGMIGGTVAGWMVIFSPMDSLWVAPTSALVSLVIPLAGRLVMGPAAASPLVLVSINGKEPQT